MTAIEQNITFHPTMPVPALVNVSETAANRLAAMMQERQLEGFALRVFVSGGGCSGLQYGMTFDDETRDGDTSWEAHGLRVLVDPVSARHLAGAEITYQQNNLLEGSFKIDNPNAVSSCGCGSSFKPKNDQAAEDYDGYDQGYSGGGCGSCGHG